MHVLVLDYTAVVVSGKVDPVKPVNHTSWVAIVTPTERPKSVRNRCIIELFCGVVCAVTLPFWQFCWYRGFCHRTESDIFLFSLYSPLFLPESSIEVDMLHISEDNKSRWVLQGKGKRSDLVLWQKPLYQHTILKTRGPGALYPWTGHKSIIGKSCRIFFMKIIHN